jgi:hypothetical protein
MTRTGTWSICSRLRPGSRPAHLIPAVPPERRRVYFFPHQLAEEQKGPGLRERAGSGAGAGRPRRSNDSCPPSGPLCSSRLPRDRSRGGERCQFKAPVMEGGPGGAGGNQLQGFRSAGARIDIASAPDGIRTRVAALKGRCPGPLDDRGENVSRAGLEPATPGLKGRCSPSELTARKKPSYYSGRAHRVNPGPRRPRSSP